MSRDRRSGEPWETTYFLVFLFGSLIAVVVGGAAVAFGGSEPAEAFGFGAGIVGLTALVLVLIALSHESCFGALLAIGFAIGVFVLTMLAALQGEGSWNGYVPR